MLILQFYIYIWEYLEFGGISMRISVFLRGLEGCLGFFPVKCFQLWSFCFLCMIFNQTYALFAVTFFSNSRAFWYTDSLYIWNLGLQLSYWGMRWRTNRSSPYSYNYWNLPIFSYYLPMHYVSLYWVHYSQMTVRRYCKLKVSVWRLMNGLVHTLYFAL